MRTFSHPGVLARAVVALVLVVACCFVRTEALPAQDVRQVLNMAYPAEGSIARLHVDLLGNPHGGWPTIVGDVNGDGHDDILWVRWSWAEDTWPDSLLVFGGPHLVGITETPITDVPHLRILHPGRPGALLPSCWRNAGPAGDADGDGFDDFIITACEFDDRGVNRAGRVIVIFGQPDFPAEAELADLDASGIRSIHIVSRDEESLLGISANRIGDINADGLEDLAIGAAGPATLGGDESGGWLYVLFGGYHEHVEIDVAEVGTQVDGFLLQGANGELHHLSGDRLGVSYVEGVGDVNGDGIDDLLVPAKGVNRAAGAVYVVYGRSDFDSWLDASDPASFGVEIQGVVENARLGSSISGIGDVDGDGLADFIAGQPAGIRGQPGAVYVIYGSDSWPERVSIGDPAVRALEILPSGPSSPSSSPKLFGWWVEGIGDWNEDGFADFAFGAPWQDVENERFIGRTYVVYGSPALPDSVLDDDIGTSVLPGLVLEGHRPPISGFGMAGDVGDIDGDERPDILVVASTFSELGQDLSPSSVSILFRDSFDAATLTLHEIDAPGEGPLEGGTRVRIRGRGFDTGAAVFFGDLVSPEVRVVHSALIEALTPASSTEGVVDVEVRQGADRASLTKAFRYRQRILRDLVLDRESLNADGIRSLDIAGLGLRAQAADMNADGRTDLVVSSSFGDNRGQVHIIFGRESWPATLTGADVTIRDEPVVEWFSLHFDVADIDGDGFGDLVLGGVDRDAEWWQAAGRTYLLRGYGANWPLEIDILDAIDEGGALSVSSRPCGATKPAFVHLPEGETRIAIAHTFCAAHDTVVDIFAPRGFETPPDLIGSIHGDAANTLAVFGSSLAVVGDMTGDGWPVLLVGETAGAGSAAYVIPGDAALLEAGETVDVVDLVANGRALRFTDGGAHISDFGLHSESVGDFNADGFPDAIISAELGGFQLQGRSYLVFGSPDLGGRIRELDLSEDGPTHMTITGEQSGDTAGYGQGVGDLNGDGYSDLLIAGSYQDSGEHKVHVVLGERDPPPSIDLIRLRDRGFEIVAPEGVIFPGTGANENISVVGADLDGDGNQDLAIPYRRSDPREEGIFVIFGPIVPSDSDFIRGDANDDGNVDLSDAVAILGFLFLGEATPRCLDAADTNDGGNVDLSDAVNLLNHLFLGAGPLPPPYPERGDDPTPDALTCS